MSPAPSGRSAKAKRAPPAPTLALPPEADAAASEAPATASTNASEWTVSELAGALRRTLEDRFGHVRVRGEIFGYRGPHASGHVYFCLKDREARIDAVIWKNAFARMRFKPQEGLEVVATGRITTFPGKSAYQIIIDTIEPAGVGALMALLDERRRRLTAEGLFAAERKRRLPFLPRTIGVITSPTGAVIRDILHRLEDRFPRHVVVWPVRVQGETCGDEVAAAITGFNALGTGGVVRRPDLLIVARGGGSLEDLWGFNDEAVVRAVAAGTIPLISAVGHETDWTLIDHAADLRAPTPTGAAEMAVPVRTELLAQVGKLAARQADALRRGLDAGRSDLRSAARALPSREALLAPRRQRLDLAGARLAPALLANARDHERQLRFAADRIAKQTPLIRLENARTRVAAVGTRPAELLGRALAHKAERLHALAERLGAGRSAGEAAERLRLARCRERIADLAGRSARAVRAALVRRQETVAGRADLLASLGYVSVLARGYALVRGPTDVPISRAAALPIGTPVTIEFADGRRRAVADGVRPRRRGEGASATGPLVQASLFDN